MKVTRIAYSRDLTASKLKHLKELARRLGVLRSEVWQEFGSIKGLNFTHRQIRDQWLAKGKQFNVPARLWKETLRDVIADISSYREAAKVTVRKAIPKRTSDKKHQIRLYRLLKRDKWVEDSFLCRQMRKHFKHGRTQVENQIILDTGCYKTFEQGGQAWLSVSSLVPRKRIAIPLNTTCRPAGTLRLILRGGRVEMHYAVNADKVCSTRPCGTASLGVDKGYTEVLTDSEGKRHGKGLGKLLSQESDYLKAKYQRRNKLKAVAEAKPRKARSILDNNLGRKKLDVRKRKHTSNVRNKVYKAVHSVFDKAFEVASEDLTAPIKSKKPYSKNMKRRLSGWVKGLIAEALNNVSQRRGASLVLVSASYTSQTDSRHGVLLGQRKGDLFHCFDGEVLDADENAALNIEARARDPEIGLWTPYREVRSILLRRTEHWLESQRLGLLNPDSSCGPFQGTSTESETSSQLFPS